MGTTPLPLHASAARVRQACGTLIVTLVRLGRMNKSVLLQYGSEPPTSAIWNARFRHNAT